MMFRALLGTYLAVMVINLEAIGLTAAANQLEKTLLFLVGAAFLLTRKVDKFIFSCILLIMLTTAICAVLSSYDMFDPGRYVKSAFSLFSTLLLLSGKPSEKDRVFLIKFATWLPIVCVGLGILYDIAGIRTLWYTDFLGVRRMQATSIPAGLGSFAYLGSVAAMLMAVYFDKRYFFITLVNIMILLLSAARMPLALAIGICLIVYYSFYARTVFQAYLSTSALAVFAAAAFFAVGDGIMNRFESNSLSGRDLLWEALNAVLAQYPGFGIGLGHQITVVPEDVMVKAATFAAHDEYLRLSLETGYVGATIIYSLLAAIFIYYMVANPRARNAIYISIIASFFVYCRTDNAISSGITPIMLVLAMFNFRQPGKAPARQRAVQPPIAQPVEIAPQSRLGYLRRPPMRMPGR
jgi:hypothetical protein